MIDLPNGFVAISGKRNPPEGSGPYYVLLRNGMQPKEPWPIAGTRWIWEATPHDFDIIAIRAEPKAKREGRQDNGSYE
jgi:hypothetical protein